MNEMNIYTLNGVQYEVADKKARESLGGKADTSYVNQTFAPALPLTMEDSRALVLGWGRIGKCLALLLKRMGADVSVAARKETDLAMAASLGFRGIPFQQAQLQPYDIVFNTIPVPVLTLLHGNPIKIDLASCKGLPGEDVIWARFLPAADAPASTGRLIAKTIVRILEKEVIT